MLGPHFISYAPDDAQSFACRLYDTLQAISPSIPVWLDQRCVPAGEDYDEASAAVLATSASVLAVLSRDSVHADSLCQTEWTTAANNKRPITLLRIHPDAVVPAALSQHAIIDFTGAFELTLAALLQHLRALRVVAEQLDALTTKLLDTQRALRNTRDPRKKAALGDIVAELERQIAEQQRIVENQRVADQRSAERIERGIERERQPKQLVSGISTSKFVNPPPGRVPSHWQDRVIETQLVGTFLADEAHCLIMIVGRGGVGKTPLVVRLLQAVEQGRLPDDGAELHVDGIVYLTPGIVGRVRRLLEALAVMDDTNVLKDVWQVATLEPGPKRQEPAVVAQDTREQRVDPAQVDSRQLHEVLVEKFSVEELELLCATLQHNLRTNSINIDVSLEVVGGKTSPTIVNNLIAYLERRGFLPYLVAAVRRERPGSI